jgi:RNA polymerase sigma-70 factor (ECF subfamily)
MKNASAESLKADEATRRADAQAVARTLAGDMTAFDRLIEKHQRRAVAVSYRLLGNIDDAMDVCQEAFVRAYRSLQTLQEPERFGAWLMRIVSNLSLNYRRGRRPSLSLTTGDDEAGGEDRVSEAASRTRHPEEDSLRQAEVEQAISAAIDELPEQQRLALILFAIEQLPQKEVAEIVGCSVEMVKWNVFQARKYLKGALAQYLGED